MSLQPYYEDSYQSERGKAASDLISEVVSTTKGLTNFVTESKDRFIGNADWNGLKVLELGSGRGGVSLQLAKLGANVTLVDFSPSALAQAESLFAQENLKGTFLQGDVTFPDLEFDGTYDIIVDSHLLHCICSDPERSSYYRLVLDRLSSRGIFVAESMVHRKKLFIPDGFMFDEQNILWQMFGKWTPVRRILDSLDLEAELTKSGFHIAFFYYYASFGFVPHMRFMDIPNEILPASVRMVLQKKQL